MARLSLAVFSLLLCLTMSIAFAWVNHIQRRNFPLAASRRWSRLLASAPSRTLQDVALPLEKSPQFLFVGGKGGVGKTTTSSAIALALSDRGHRTLVVSTDPAHSLGDALDTPLRPGLVTPITSEQNLWALEIDVEHSLQKLKQSVQGFDAEAIARSLGVPREMVDSFGLSDVASVFSNPPPGIDEIIGLAQIFRYAEFSLSPQTSTQAHSAQSFDRIVIDTAPTGHTLRLLQLPDFLDSFTGKLIKFRAKMQGAVSSLKALFGGKPSSGAELQQILQSLERLQQDVAAIRSILKDNEQTQFVVVTIPTVLAVEESKRLLRSLEQESIGVSSIVCNQVIDLSADHKYLETRSKGQRASLRSLQTFIDCAVNPQRAQPMQISLVPFVDTEVTGVHGLRYFHSIAHKPEDGQATDPLDARPLTIFSGKGGVGKTTSAASLAMRLCDSGFKTLVVSCDPAHSLGDALQENLSGVPRFISPAPSGSGQLWAMEIDPSLAVEEFKTMMKSQISPAQQQQPQLLPNIQQEMGEVLGAVNDPPPGIDEIVALSKVLSLLEEGYRTADGQHVQFDKIVLDTAPTGHTLRMLDMPKFMRVMLRKLRHIREKTDSMSSLINMFGGGGAQQTSPQGEDILASFEAKFDRVDHILHDEYESEFVVVTIPSELAVAETKRLLTKLSDSKVPHRRVIVNQVLPSDQEDPAAATAFLDKLRKGQAESIERLQTISTKTGVPLVQVPYFDAETRTVYGLRSISNIIFKDVPQNVGDV